MCHTIIPFAKCRPIYTLKDLLASCSANVGQYQGITQEGGMDYHCATAAVAVKSTVSHPPTYCCPTTHPPSSPRADRNSFPTRLSSAG